MSTSSAPMPSASPMMQKPKRPLSAYNFFFQSERQKLLANNQRKGFAGLARTVAMKWKATTDTKTFEDLARKDKIRYLQEMAEWKKEEKARKKEQRKSNNNKKSTKNTNDNTKQQQAGTPSTDAIVSSQEQDQQQQQQQQHQMFARHVSVESSLNGEGGCTSNAEVAPAYVPSSSLVNSLFQQQQQQQQQVFQDPSSLFPLDLFDTSNTAPLQQQQQQQQFQQQQEQQELSDFLTPLSVDASDFMFADCSSSSSSCNDNKGQQHAIQEQQQDSLCSLLTAAQNPLLEDEQEQQQQQQQQQQPLDYHQEESPLSSMLPLPLPTSWTTTTALSPPPTSGEMNLKFHNIDRLSQVLDADTVDLVIGMFGN